MAKIAHLSFLNDASVLFLDAFRLHELQAAADEKDIHTAAACARSLYVAIEKGLKHTLAELDPYLVIAKPDATKIRNIRKDLVSRPVPTIFCGRTRIETVAMVEAWGILRDLSPSPAVPIERDVIVDFDLAIGRLAELRHRAQHGEVYEDINEMLAIVGQVFARFYQVGRALMPAWFKEMCERNGQLESRLKGLEKQIDASWQVFVDYLRVKGPMRISVRIFTTSIAASESVHVLIGGEGDENPILASTDVPNTSATGLFGRYLTKQQADERYQARHAEEQRKGLVAWAASHLQSPPGVGVKGSVPKKRKPFPPLEPGSLRVPATGAWITLELPGVAPGSLRFSANLIDLHLAFPSATEVEGAASGAIDCAVVKGSARPERVLLSGPAYFDSEWNFTDEASGDERTVRTIDADLTMTVDEGDG